MANLRRGRPAGGVLFPPVRDNIRLPGGAPKHGSARPPAPKYIGITLFVEAGDGQPASRAAGRRRPFTARQGQHPPARGRP